MITQVTGTIHKCILEYNLYKRIYNVTVMNMFQVFKWNHPDDSWM